MCHQKHRIRSNVRKAILLNDLERYNLTYQRKRQHATTIFMLKCFKKVYSGREMPNKELDVQDCQPKMNDNCHIFTTFTSLPENFAFDKSKCSIIYQGIKRILALAHESNVITNVL